MPTATRRPLGPEVLAAPAHQALAREAAAKAVVLLQNEPVDGRAVLPIDPGVATGRGARPPRRRAQPRRRRVPATSTRPSVVTALDGLRAALPHAEVVHADGSDLAAAAASAASADVADRRGRLHPSRRGRVHRRQRHHPPALAATRSRRARRGGRLRGPAPERSVWRSRDPSPAATRWASPPAATASASRSTTPTRQLIEAVAAANPRTVVCLVAGSAVLTEAWRHRVPALAQIWYSGMQGGHGIADVLTGRRRRDGTAALHRRRRRRPPPSVRPRRRREVVYDAWHGYWRLARDRNEPAFPFGFGLSYTSWQPGPTTLDDDGDDLLVRAAAHQHRRTRRRRRGAGLRRSSRRLLAAGAATGGLRARRGRRGSQRRGRAAHPVVAAGGPGSRPSRVGGAGPGPTCSPSAATAPTSTPSTSSSTGPT